MVDTVRSVDELLNLLFADGQPKGAITEQDIRDAIVSTSLETADLSGLPRASGGLNIGRLWLDNLSILRVVTHFQPFFVMDHAATLGGTGGFAADGRKPGTQIWSGAATFNGAGAISSNPTVRQGSASALLAGTGTIAATTVRRLVATSAFAGAGSLSATSVQRDRATASVAGSGSFTGNGTTASGEQWGTVNASITKSNGNLTITKSSNDGTDGVALPTQFKTTGKWYWEVHVDTFTNLAVGLANPSATTADGSGLGDVNSFQYYTFQGTGGVSANGNFVTSPDAFTTGSVISFALDMTNGSWWTRVNGGGWTGNSGAGGDPATNNNPIPTNLITTTGGLGPAAGLVGVGEGVTLKIASGSWTYSAPSGFTAM